MRYLIVFDSALPSLTPLSIRNRRTGFHSTHDNIFHSSFTFQVRLILFCFARSNNALTLFCLVLSTSISHHCHHLFLPPSFFQPSHSQMNRRIFEAFQIREQKVNEYMAGCGRKYGMSCTCGPDCRCANCSEHCRSTKTDTNTSGVATATAAAVGTVGTTTQTTLNDTNSMTAYQNDVFTVHEKPESMLGGRNSFISFGGNMRHMSITSTSEATFGRAMSGLSALSIDWENMEDFDVNVDHSAHINNTSPHQDIGGSSGGTGVGTGATGTTAGQYGGVRRSSLRRSINTMNTDDSQTAQVSFKV